jgi:hypothetical protein
MSDRVIITQKQADALTAAGVVSVEVAYTIPRALAETLGAIVVQPANKPRKKRAESVMCMKLSPTPNKYLNKMRPNTVTSRAAAALMKELTPGKVYRRAALQDMLLAAGFDIAETVWLPKSLLTVGFIVIGDPNEAL